MVQTLDAMYISSAVREVPLALPLIAQIEVGVYSRRESIPRQSSMKQPCGDVAALRMQAQHHPVPKMNRGLLFIAASATTIDLTVRSLTPHGSRHTGRTRGYRQR